VNQTDTFDHLRRDGNAGPPVLLRAADAPAGARYDRGVPAVPAPSVQVFGREDNQPTRAALRFFKERRVSVHFVDLRRKPIAPGELQRFVAKLGAPALADTTARAWRETGLGYLRMDGAELAARLLADTRLLRLPLVRNGNAVTAGPADATWKTWFTAPGP
jgi:arsenate reductase-like glutaredoxin family protein